MCGSPKTATSCRTRRCRLRLKTDDCRAAASRNSTRSWYCSSALLLVSTLVSLVPAQAQTAYSWEQVKARFESANPTLKADAINVDEMKAEEVTAYLRPNPQFTLSSDGTQIAPHNGVWQPTK